MQLDKMEFEDFNPLDFLELSCELNSEVLELKSSSSSVKRTIFSRTYYAVFIFLRELLSDNTDYISNPYGEHRRLPNFIERKGPFCGNINEVVAKDINILKKLRHQSDYYLEVPSKGTKEYNNWLFYNTDYAIDVANRIITLFKKHFKNS